DRYEKSQYRIRILDAQLASAKASVASAEGKLREVQASTDLARQELAEAKIVSPIDGVVLHRYLEEGDSVSSIRVAGGNATTIMTLGDLSEIYVDGEVDEVDVGKIVDQQRIRPDLVARVTVESFKGRTFLGRVARIAPLGLQDSNGIVTFEVRIVLDNTEKLLLANMTANSQIVLEEHTDVLLLSQGALVTEGTTRYALIYNPVTRRSRRQEVTPGISDGSQVEIGDLGLAPGEKIVIP
ncbi:MAG TPA: efflux RND transporter periplasmic adaptor subunit, partial [Planctomycetota bacterium]|nr:efflux RND transporter periplasmic adaptor subunit [Planctomycetota bacterium]